MRSLYGVLLPGAEARNEIAARMFDGLALRGGNAATACTSLDCHVGIRGEAGDISHAIVSSAGGAIVAAVEGEIYNARELRQLAGLPADPPDGEHGFEFIPALYEKFGADFPRRMNGVFGIALYDARRRRLHLVRDHAGSHSLFYGAGRDGVAFATTIHSVLDSGLVSRELSLAAMNDYFASTTIPAPVTLFKEIACVRPGSMAIWEAGRWTEHCYWPSQELTEDFQRPESEWVDEVRATILDAIAIRAGHSGKCGSLLSGGLDTSTIAATLVKLRGVSAPPLPVFSIAFPQKEFSDADLQEIFIGRYPVARHTKTLAASEFADVLGAAVAHLDKPVNDTAFVGMYHAFRLAREAGCDTVFDGEGPDELFFTRHGLARMKFQRYLRVLPEWFRRSVLRAVAPSFPVGTSAFKRSWRFLYRLGLTEEERTLSRLPSFYGHSRSILTARGAGLPDPYRIGKQYLAGSRLVDPLNRYHYGISKTYLPDGLLFKNERMAAANGILNRTPFVDFRLVELAFRIPTTFKLTEASATDDGTKQVYKKAIRGMIPDEILERKKKRGFSQPSSVWYRDELRGFVTDSLFSADSLCLNYCDRAYMRRLWDEHAGGTHNHDYLINSILILELWLRAFRGAGIRACQARIRAGLSGSPTSCDSPTFSSH